MSCYDNDDIYFFGFSRGAYVARFLAEMLDHVGLLSQGNEEMARFAWKAFAQWQQRDESTEEEKKKKADMLEYLQHFRDTFSRPVRRIRFLGLFDTGEICTWLHYLYASNIRESEQRSSIRERMDATK